MDAGTLQRIMGHGWPGLEQAMLGEWELRAGAGFTGRANSCLPVGDPGLSLDDAIDHVVAFYRDRGIRPRFQVPFPAHGPCDPAPGFDSELAARGWVAEPPTLVMIARPEELTLPVGVDVESFEFHWASEPSHDWLAMYHYRGGELPEEARRVITATRACYLTVRNNGAMAGIGRATPHDGWVGLAAIEVAPAFRRRGLGSAITVALAKRGLHHGARNAYLQVFAHNPAVSLYLRLGFGVHHRYHYRHLEP